MKILITGAEGFIGSALAWNLHGEHEIIAVDYLKSFGKSNLPKDSQYINHDISIPFYFLGSKIDMVMHYAVVSQEVVGNSPELEQINIKGMLNVLEFCRKGNVPLVFPSSCSIYGPGVLHKTSDPKNPKSLYGVGKLSCEEYAKFYHYAFGLDIVILRYSNIYGDTTYVDNKFYPGKKDAARIFMEHALADQPLPVIDGEQTRDFTFIDDCVEGTVKFMNLKGLSVINIATGVETSVNRLATLVAESLEWKLKTGKTPRRNIDDIPRRSIDITGVSDLWKPKRTLEEGLKEYAKRMRRKC